MKKLIQSQTTLDNKFPKKQLLSYLKKTKSTTVSKLTQKQIYQIFSLARNDFIQGEIFFEDFTSICNHLWFSAIPTKDKGTPFANILLDTAELSYYIRKANDKETANIVTVNLSNALTFTNSNSIKKQNSNS